MKVKKRKEKRKKGLTIFKLAIAVPHLKLSNEVSCGSNEPWRELGAFKKQSRRPYR